MSNKETSRRGFLAAALGAITVACSKSSPKFSLGALANNTFTLSDDQKSSLQDVKNAKHSRESAISDLEREDPLYKAPVIGKLYIDALNEDNKDLAVALVKYSPMLRAMQFTFTLRGEETSKDYLTLTKQGFSLDRSGEVPVTGRDWDIQNVTAQSEQKLR